jgi:putative endonuclease
VDNYCRSNTCFGKYTPSHEFRKCEGMRICLVRFAGARAQSIMPCYVYVLVARNSNGRPITYVGWTLDLERRLAEHNGRPGGAKSTRGRQWALVYAEKYCTREGAMKREYVLKNDRAFRAALREL